MHFLFLSLSASFARVLVLTPVLIYACTRVYRYICPRIFAALTPRRMLKWTASRVPRAGATLNVFNQFNYSIYNKIPTIASYWRASPPRA